MSRLVEITVEHATEEDVERLCEALLHDGLARILAAMLALPYPFRERLPALVEAVMSMRQDGAVVLACDMPHGMGACLGEHPHLDRALQAMHPRGGCRTSAWM